MKDAFFILTNIKKKTWICAKKNSNFQPISALVLSVYKLWTQPVWNYKHFASVFIGTSGKKWYKSANEVLAKKWVKN